MIWLLAIGGLFGFGLGSRIGLFGLMATTILASLAFAVIAALTGLSVAVATITATTAFEFAAFASMTLRGWRDVAEPFPYPQTKRHGAGLKHAATR